MRRLAAALAASPLLAVLAVTGSPTDRAATAPATQAGQATLAMLPDVPAPIAAELASEPPDMFTAQRAGVDGTVPADAYARALAQADALAAQSKASGSSIPAWRLEGPTNIGGRVLDVVVDRKGAIYAAAASGGVWVSRDNGKRFAPAWPAGLTQAIGALAISKSGVLYAGTGEAGPGGGSLTYGGTGVYRSKDGGKTWQNIGLKTSSRIGRIAIDPKDERRVFVAATGNLYRTGGDRGLYLTTNSGASWKRVLSPETPTTGAVDVAIDPKNPKRVYASMWDNSRRPQRRAYNGLGSGLFRSSDGGQRWERIGQPWLAASPTLGRIGIAVAPSDPNRVYAVATAELGQFFGFYVSTDGGTTFTPRADAEIVTGSSSFGWWFGRVYVDPRDAEKVFSTGVGLSVSTNGGTSWANASGVHADQHGMAWDPRDPEVVYLGNDGGVYRSEDGGGEWEFAEHQPWSQLYSIDVAEDDARRIVAGLQDNGSNRSWDVDGEIAPRGSGWTTYLGGDGEAVAINPEDHDIVYGCYQYGNCSVSTNAGNTSSSYTNEVAATRKNWFTPVVLDPVNPSIVYTGGESLWRSEDNAQTWRPIGGATLDFSNGPGTDPDPSYTNYGTITTIAVTDQDTGVIVVGTDDGNVWVSTNAGEAFTKVVSPVLPKAWVTRVAIDQDAPDTLYATYSGYRAGDGSAHVFRSTDSGKTWSNIGKGLPAAPVNDVVVVGSHLVVATDVGVYRTTDGGRRWTSVGSGLPRAPVTDLRWHRRTQRLFAATFGRSAWSVSYPAPSTRRSSAAERSRGAAAAPAATAPAKAETAARTPVTPAEAPAARLATTPAAARAPVTTPALPVLAALGALVLLAARGLRRQSS